MKDTGDWKVEVVVRAPSGNEDHIGVLAHGLTVDEAYELALKLEEEYE